MLVSAPNNFFYMNLHFICLSASAPSALWLFVCFCIVLLSILYFDNHFSFAQTTRRDDFLVVLLPRSSFNKARLRYKVILMALKRFIDERRLTDTRGSSNLSASSSAPSAETAKPIKRWFILGYESRLFQAAFPKALLLWYETKNHISWNSQSSYQDFNGLFTTIWVSFLRQLLQGLKVKVSSWSFNVR